MMSMRHTVWRATLLLSVCAGSFGLAGLHPAAADEILLKKGQRISGEVLKETDEAIFVDLGVEVVRVPLDEIRSRSASETSSKMEETSARGIYTVGRMTERSIKALAELLGPAVVLVSTPSGLGSGFIIDAEGHCVTNYHVIELETQIAATLFEKGTAGGLIRSRVNDVEILAINPFLDLALIKLPVREGKTYSHVVLAETADYQEGDTSFAIGNPLGLERSVSQGIIGNKNRAFEGLTFIQTTTEINPGNSGGPLFNTRGEVIGVTNMKLLFAEGLGFAIPIDYVKQFLDNRSAFAFDRDNPNSGYRYHNAPPRTARKPTAES